MQIVHHWKQLSQKPIRTVLTIGNFDGVHLGHRAVFALVVKRAAEFNGTPAVYTFCPHPLKLLSPSKAPLLINTMEEKERLIAEAGIQLMLCPPFDHDMAAMSAKDFVRSILVEKLALRHLVVGADYAFGRGREGDVAFLEEQGAEYGFTVEALAPVKGGELVCSSTRIRHLVREGNVREAAKLLGRLFNLSGRVINGDKRGRVLGFPTANLASEKELVPADGVYAVKVILEGRKLLGVANVGRKPTYGGQAAGVEVHLLDYSDDLYGRVLDISFVERLRDEKEFESSSALQEAIRNDIQCARKCLGL